MLGGISNSYCFMGDMVSLEEETELTIHGKKYSTLKLASGEQVIPGSFRCQCGGAPTDLFATNSYSVFLLWCGNTDWICFEKSLHSSCAEPCQYITNQSGGCILNRKEEANG